VLDAFSPTVIWLPPYICDLNVCELASGKIRHLIRVHKLSGSGAWYWRSRTVRYEKSTCNAKDWKGYTRHYETCESAFGKW